MTRWGKKGEANWEELWRFHLQIHTSQGASVHLVSISELLLVALPKVGQTML